MQLRAPAPASRQGNGDHDVGSIYIYTYMQAHLYVHIWVHACIYGCIYTYLIYV